MKKIVFLGEKPIKSSPSLELGNILKTLGYTVIFSENIDHFNTKKFLRQILKAKCLIVVDYDITIFRIRQLALARLLGVPIIRWWVGTDVYNCIHNKELRKRNYILSKFSLNIVVAGHLRTELKECNINSIVIPSVTYNERIAQDELNFEKSILVYMPTNRKDFYNFTLICKLIERFSNVKFIVVADESHSLKKYSNVVSLGWVDDMSKVWPHVGCLLRLTEHDGLPRMVIQALRRCKYVIYSWPLYGCWHVWCFEDCVKYIFKFLNKKDCNKDGPIALKHILGEVSPEQRYVQTIEHISKSRFFKITEITEAIKFLFQYFLFYR